jgi:GxxExxY protein
MEINQITEIIIGKAIQVHRNLGPGLLESAYKECLYYELTEAGLNVEKEKAMPLVYQKVKLECGYRVDLFVENQIIVELKAVEFLNDVHLAQILTYLKIANRQTGLLINFNVSKLTDGIKRVYNKYYFKE